MLKTGSEVIAHDGGLGNSRLDARQLHVAAQGQGSDSQEALMHAHSFRLASHAADI
ncbi:hypothetical protein [Variovorax sp. EBFNA2]|uniref:hypothetical protein n=1 Tax=Variovorax sp. EBFNA2 TaxID=3342097 RepID=UPI0029C064A5|nr:hypothetical protein [Variovorax boronicumulans]WPG41364.1 hypothetical protein RZE79_31095 [Variovorax boronicumulans]